MRPPPSRAQSATPAFNGRASPADSMVSASTSASRVLRSPQNSVHGGTKRKERDFEQDTGEETNINVVVRCRGRSEREVRENSGVVVSTDGIKGKNVELSMGPSALSNKTYHFDKVFSPAADQNIIFEEVVTPILDEVLGGFNCTLFAYGQTGTGKTYTMSGDITDMQPLPPEAGIIPRVLFSLFTKLESEESEHSVKCSFIELYNEELRDLLSVDDTAKLKIFEDTGKKGGNTTMVQGMEESHIKTASKGIQLLREGSHKRQVAATKCNDLSSRSHTVFTITVYMKRTADTGEEFISAGKLNLVDLAGSENIQRSGAENKRAAEAGLINKSLLTLGRVINALVDKSSHIPYRESKLTRLLQDSLGGRTKTCIIATLSPAKSNLEETISTLDYAFRAKNIRNKPQVNSTVSKKTLLKEFTAEIEKLKTELIATRHRNGVYLTTETYEEMTTESESRRILSEEQRDKIETMETNLRNKVQELFSLTTNFNHLKKENEATRLTLQGTEDILTKTESVLRLTQQNLTEETAYRKAHQVTEEQLTNMGSDMISTLGRTTSDINGLRSKIRRRSDLQSLNRRNWTSSQRQVSNVTGSVEDRIEELQAQQRRMIISLSTRMQDFVHDELQKLSTSQTFLQDKIQAFEASRDEVNQQTSKARDDMNEVLEEIKTLREGVKEKVGAGLDSLSAAAQRISAGIVTELEAFHTQLHASYSSLGKDFKSTFDDLIRRLNEQHSEANELRSQIVKADATLLEANKTTQSRLVSALAEQKQKAACERAQLLQDVTNLVNASAEASDRRLDDYVTSIANEIKDSGRIHEQERAKYETGMEGWKQKSKGIIEDVLTSRETVKSKIKGDWTAANEHTNSIRNTTTSVHDETIRIVDAQMAHMETQLSSLDELVSRVRAQNETHHAAHTTSLAGLSSSVQDSYSSISSHLETSYDRVKDLNSDMSSRTQDLQNTLPSLDSGAQIRGQLKDLRDTIATANITEYTITGETPQKAEYIYPTTLPRTEAHDKFLAKLRGEDIASPEKPSTTNTLRSPRKPSSPSKSRPGSPTKPKVFADALPPPQSLIPTLTANTTSSSSSPPSPSATAAGTIPSRPTTAGNTSLRELDPNTIPSSSSSSSSAAAAAAAPTHAHPNPMLRSASASDTTGVLLDAKAADPTTTSTAASVDKLRALDEMRAPPLKRQNTAVGVEKEADGKGRGKRAGRMTVAGVGLGAGIGHGVENERVGQAGGGVNLNASVGPGAGGRVLRRRGERGSD
ncbi:kinesin heavy chain [Viridothelium virens]|uniref:Kinesin heavy chain n=1 Tax=Viridothelium virens TaxID=1048519 RepID=A0A6A6GX23_VIRVR|nr:kinesin heavy chain [Viridothelium virens]